MAEDLRAFLEGRVVQAHRTGAVVELRKWVRRNTATAASLAAVVLLAVGGSVLVALLQAGARSSQAQLSQQLSEKNQSLTEQSEDLQRALRESRWASYVLGIRDVQEFAERGDLAEARRRLEACPEEFRGLEWHHLDHMTDLSLATLSGHVGAIRCMAFSQDGRLLVSGSSDGTVRVWNVSTGEQLALLEGDSRVVDVAFASDDRVVSVAGDATLWLWDFEQAAEPRWTYVGDEDRARAGKRYGVMAASIGGRGGVVVTVGFPKGDVRVWDVLANDLIGSLTATMETEVAVCVDGSEFALVDDRDGLRTYRTRPLEMVAALDGELKDLEYVRIVAYSSDAGHLLVGRRIWDLTRNESTAIADRFSEVAAIHPRGDSGIHGDVEELTLWSLGDEPEARATVRGPSKAETLVFSPDAELIASGLEDGRIQLRDANVQRGPARIDDSGASCSSARTGRESLLPDTEPS